MSEFVNEQVRVPLEQYDAAIEALGLAADRVPVASGWVEKDGTVVLITRRGEHRWKPEAEAKPKRRSAPKKRPAPKKKG